MDVYLLNSSFQIVKIIDDFSSLIWRRKLHEAGDFELHCSHEQFLDIATASYVCRPDSPEIGIIENHGLSYPTAFCKGRFLERLLFDKIIYPAKAYSNKTHEYIARDLISSFFPAINLAAANDPLIGSGITTQVTGDNLMEYLYKLLSTVDASFSLTCDLSTSALSFSVWKGQDRRQSAIFSSEWDNLVSFSFEFGDKDYRNYAVVAGAGEGSSRQFVTIDQSGGGRRRELFVDARDLQPDEDESSEDYAARLYQRGLEKLSEYTETSKVEAEVDPKSNLVYGQDFDLGDLCIVKDDAHGIVCEKRITELEEVFENGTFVLSLVLGDGYLSLPQYIERRLK